LALLIGVTVPAARPDSAASSLWAYRANLCFSR
jgi:chromosome segregation ATPase